MAKHGFKILSLTIAGMVASIVVTLIIVNSLYSTNQDHNEVIKREQFARLVTDAAYQLSILAGEYGLYREERARVQWLQRHETLGRLLQDSQYLSKSTKLTIERLRGHHTRSLKLFEHLQNHPLALKNGSEDKSMTFHHKRLISGLLAATQAMVSQTSILISHNKKAHNVATSDAQWLLTGLVLLLIWLLVSLWIMIVVRIILPIRALGADIHAFGIDMSYRIKKERDDEIGDVASAFNRVARKLRETMVSREALIQ